MTVFLVAVVFVALDVGMVLAGLSYLHRRRVDADITDLRNRPHRQRMGGG